MGKCFDGIKRLDFGSADDPDRPETAKHGYGRCTHPHVESDVCQWPGNAQRFMQALGLTK